ncbi:MAG: universal stress protein [Bacteroidia bacterium]|nr:universal stress protein [Bacteroidia bacterium]
MKNLSTILYPIEFNDHDQNAIASIAEFAKNNQATLDILHVVENNLPPYQVTEPTAGLVGAAQNYLAGFLAKYAPNAGKVTSKVVSGKVNPEILSYIETSNPDLVIMPVKNTGEEGSRHLGGTAYRILSSSSVPVLTLTQGANLRPKKILLPIDVYFGIYDAKRILFDYFRNDPPEIEVMICVNPNDPDQEQNREKRILKYELSKFAELGFNKIHGKIISNDSPADAITWRANEGGFDMVVMSTHGRSGLSQFFLGSTTAQVIHTASVPVFTIKAENHGKGIGYTTSELSGMAI